MPGREQGAWKKITIEAALGNMLMVLKDIQTTSKKIAVKMRSEDETDAAKINALDKLYESYIELARMIVGKRGQKPVEETPPDIKHGDKEYLESMYEDV